MKHSVAGYFFIMALLCAGLAWYSSLHFSQFSPALIKSTTQQVIGISTKAPEELQTTITRVIDGDTILTKENQKVRYIGINAPETGQPYGQQATDYNKSLVLGKTVTVVYDKQQKDQYGRLLGYVYDGNAFINLVMVQKGWAIAENIAPNVAHQQDFAVAEKQAKRTCQGLWSDTCMPQTESCLKISNMQYDAPGVDDQNLNGEWVEIINNCPVVVDLQDWLLKDSSATNSYSFGAISLGPSQLLHLHSGCGINTAVDIYWQCPAKQHAVWNNTGDEAMLFDSHGKLLSVYKY